MAELKPIEVIMKIDFASSNGIEVVAHAERVQELVRCKDCIHGIPESYDTVTMKFSDERYCYRHHMGHFGDYYCADGKRKGGGAE